MKVRVWCYIETYTGGSEPVGRAYREYDWEPAQVYAIETGMWLGLGEDAGIRIEEKTFSSTRGQLMLRVSSCYDEPPSSEWTVEMFENTDPDEVC